MAASSRFRLPPPLSFLLVVCLAVPASAQQIAYTATGVVETHGRIDLGTGVDTLLTDSPIGVYTSDGQYGLRQEGAVLRLWHVPTGAATTIASDFQPRFAHPRDTIVFGQSQGVPARLDAAGVHLWPVCTAAPGAWLAMDLSADGRVLALLCGADLLRLDTGTGLEIGRLANAGIAGGFALNDDGAEVTAWRSGVASPELVRVRVADGQVLASRALSPVDMSAGVASTPRRDRAVATTCRIVSVNLVCTATLIDAALADVRILGAGFIVAPGVTVSPDGHDAFVTGLDYAGAGALVWWLDVDTGAVRAQVASPPGGAFAMVYLAAPLPPVLAAPAVTGGAASLAWTLPTTSPQAVAYRLEAGFAPGATAVSIDLGAAMSITIPGVPPGRYYARLRAVNYNGVSAPSNEIVVDVP